MKIFPPIPEIFELVPCDIASQFSARSLIGELPKLIQAGTPRILDLGCGDGRSFDWFKKIYSSMSWVGLDIESSPEVDSRSRSDCVFQSFNGVDIPFYEGEFDVVFSNQVFEHVRFPEKLLCEVQRVLRVGGAFIGSVSYLEPYHSKSLFNYTPYGWLTINVESGLRLELMAGGIDSLALIKRSLSNVNEPEAWTMSSLNREIINDESLSIQEKNYKILMYSGHIVFIARKSSVI